MVFDLKLVVGGLSSVLPRLIYLFLPASCFMAVEEYRTSRCVDVQDGMFGMSTIGVLRSFLVRLSSMSIPAWIVGDVLVAWWLLELSAGSILGPPKAADRVELCVVHIFQRSVNVTCSVTAWRNQRCV